MSSTNQFADLGVAPDIVEALTKRGITAPFEIQALSIEDSLSGRDVCGKAKTGSGKTLAFGIPCVQKISKAQPGRPTALALVPTRELATQVCKELKPLAAVRNMKVEAIYGGAPIEKQIALLAKGVELVVATPGRMIDFLSSGTTNLRRVTYLVLDEADRMLDMGFEPQV